MASRVNANRTCKKNISYVEPPALHFLPEKHKKYGKNELFEVEVVERDQSRKRVKIHYVSYGKEFDKWVDDKQNECPLVMMKPYFSPGNESFLDRKETFYECLGEKIQGCLSGDRLKDPECRFDVEGDQDVFDDLLQKCTQDTYSKYYPAKFSDLDCVLGSRWDEKIYTRLGDFAYIVEGTLKFSVRSRKPNTRYLYQGGAYVESVKKRKPVLVTSFVIRSSNRKAYERRWKS